ncbi:MAG: DUF4838 domain-containing protein [Candidatus Moduliflexus flocculans]|nr:DUF4838 domain-containing protein [Candidatus Moduliflexus flocculans]
MGGAGKGAIYGVVHLLEKYFGCRRFSPTAELFPPHDDLALGCLFEAVNPANDVRVVNGDFALDADWRDWMRLDDIRELYGDGYYVHTFQRLVPWQTWFAAHPEYFALMNGKRIIDQPCLTRPEVFDIAVDRPARGDGRPAGQEDLVGEPERQLFLLPVPRVPEGHRGGGLARRADHPLRQPRRRALPRQDDLDPGLPVLPPGAPANPASARTSRSCSARSSSTAAGPSPRRRRALHSSATSRTGAASAPTSISGTTRSTSRTRSRPSPTCACSQPNIRFFVERGVRKHFQQTNTGPGHEWSELKSYLLARLLWDPKTDVDAATDEFLDGYYGRAGRPLRRYIDALHDALTSVRGGARHLRAAGGPRRRPSLGRRYGPVR